MATTRSFGFEDAIICTEEDGEAGCYQWSLELGPGISWWKGIKVFDKAGSELELIATQDSEGKKTSAAVNASTFGKLEIWKAKAFGVHTHMYTVPDHGTTDPMIPAAGKRMALSWVRDNGLVGEPAIAESEITKTGGWVRIVRSQEAQPARVWDGSISTGTHVTVTETQRDSRTGNEWVIVK